MLNEISLALTNIIFFSVFAEYDISQLWDQGYIQIVCTGSMGVKHGVDYDFFNQNLAYRNKGWYLNGVF